MIQGKTQLRGFTLLEMLMVIVILAILASIVVPPLLQTDEDAKISAAQQVLRQVNQQIKLAQLREGHWPSNIDRAWFTKDPTNPLVPNHSRKIYDDVDGANNPNKWHPRDKTTSSFPFWYNKENGVLRVRVPRQESNSQTLEFYNEVNQTAARSISDTKM